mmetsp:Transcript_83787/g.237634  ORF Transcript_83787/g.237634 Transcript_83787/m.237634 type:complete len:218 (+) Transcript_83787:67-720(+)
MLSGTVNESHAPELARGKDLVVDVKALAIERRHDPLLNMSAMQQALAIIRKLPIKGFRFWAGQREGDASAELAGAMPAAAYLALRPQSDRRNGSSMHRAISSFTRLPIQIQTRTLDARTDELDVDPRKDKLDVELADQSAHLEQLHDISILINPGIPWNWVWVFTVVLVLCVASFALCLRFASTFGLCIRLRLIRRQIESRGLDGAGMHRSACANDL